MKLELDINSSQNASLINHSAIGNDSGSEEAKKMLRSGISLAKEGNRAEARQMLLSVTEVDSNNETAWLWLASISEYPEELLVFLQNVLRINPENERALEWAKQTKSLLSKTFVQRGISAAQNNQKEFAKQCFLQGIVHDSENEMAWLWLASTSDSQEEKVSHLQQVLRINPENETALSSLNAVRGQMSHGLLKKANSAAISGDHESARQTLNSILKNSPNIEEAWILKAFLASDFYEKVECYEKALEINAECEAAQAGLASLKMMMPKVPKPVVEVAEPVVEEEKALEEPELPEIAVSMVAKEVREEVVSEVAVEEIEEVAEFDEYFDLEQLVEETVEENTEFSQAAEELETKDFIAEQQVGEETLFAVESPEELYAEPVQTESQVLVPEALVQQEEEPAVHETQTEVKEELNAENNFPQQSQIESIFNYEEVIIQEEALANESLAQADLEFLEPSDNPTQELDEDFARNVAASFNVSSEAGNFVEHQPKPEVATEVESQAIEVVTEILPESQVEEEAEVVASQPQLEDFYTEQVSESPVPESPVTPQQVVFEESVKPELKEEEEGKLVNLYDSMYFANDGFVVVSPNESFADYSQATAEFSYLENSMETPQPVQTIEESKEEYVAQAVEANEVFETQAVEANEVFEAQAVQTNEVFEAPAVVFEETPAELVEQSEPVTESWQTEQFAETEEVIVSQAAEAIEEVEEVEAVEEVQQVEAVEEVQQVEAPQLVEEVEQTIELQSVEEVEQLVEAQPVEEVEEVQQVVEVFEVSEEIEEVPEVIEASPIAEVAETKEAWEAAQFEKAQEIAKLVYTQVTQCPFCAFENENQAAVCNSCQAMLSLSDLDLLLSHQGVNQDLLLQAIEKMEVEKSLRDFNVEEHTFLAIAHLNTKNLQKGLTSLQEALQFNPGDLSLGAKVKFLSDHLKEIEKSKNKAEGSIGRSRTILVVDDSPTVRKLISGKLEKCGHSVLSAVDGMDALAKINEVIPDLILLDITMPRLDGYQVCKLIRNNEMTKDVPIVMISGKDGFFDKVRGRMAGSSGYITKPFGPDTLMKTIETYLN